MRKTWYVSRTKKSLFLFVYVIVGLWSVRAFPEQVSPDSPSRPPVDPFECLPAIHPGDANLDGVVDVLDLSDVLSSGKFDAGDFSSTWAEGDFNGDTLVDVLDLGEMLGNFGLRAPAVFCNRDASREFGYPANWLTVTGFEFGQIERVLVDRRVQKDLQVFSFSFQSTSYARNASSGSDGQSLMLHPKIIQREKWALLIQGLSSGKHTIEIIFGGGKSEVFDFKVSSVPESPKEISAIAGDSQVALSWTAPVNNGGSPITGYEIHFSTDGGNVWTSTNDGISSSTSINVGGLTNGTEYVFRVAARNEVGLGIWSATSAVVTPGRTSPPAGSDVCGQVGSGCYDNPQLMTAGKARLVDGTDIELVPAAGQFKVWKEKNGNRILNATGLWSSNEDWQALLDRKGTSFTDQDLTQVEMIAGRVCPPNVFLNHNNMTATGLCLYYDEGSEPQTLDLAKASGGLEGEDYLQDWHIPTSGRGEQASYYEGNIKNCADKGMRLPVLYETQSSQPNTLYYQPYGINPVWPIANGVPALIATNTWTASAHSGGFWGPIGLRHYTFHFWTWSNEVQHSIQNLESSFNASVRCVLPANPAANPAQPPQPDTSSANEVRNLKARVSGTVLAEMSSNPGEGNYTGRFVSVKSGGEAIYAYGSSLDASRGVLEFELPSDISNIASAHLVIVRHPAAGFPGVSKFQIFGYSGNGSLEVADAYSNSNPVGEVPMWDDSSSTAQVEGTISIDISEFVRSFIKEGKTFAGFMIRGEKGQGYIDGYENQNEKTHPRLLLNLTK